MEEPRYSFEEAVWKGWNAYSFYNDRIKVSWREPVRKGTREYPSDSVSGRVFEQTTFGFGVRSKLLTFGLYLVIGLVLLFETNHVILNTMGWVSLVLATISLAFLISKLRKENWIYIQKPDGSILFAVRERGLKETSREEFIREVGKYGVDNHALHSTEASSAE